MSETVDKSNKTSQLPIGFALGLTYRKVSGLFQHRLSPYGITPEQWSTLNQIDRAQGLIQKEIAERTGKDKPTTTRILDHLEKKGLIYKKPGERDRRSFLVYSTELGRSIIRETTSIEDSVTEDVRRCLSDQEYDLMLELLQRIQQTVGSLDDSGHQTDEEN
ncbi:DNA-binding MarR family transcriptional regulator [Paenibacillus cellulosilyticus]|uniref:DNA-binding MarR family transcriptional regulator n=1 Tax=Paenibacillus cellulosilyticus TaxID=375489 RepID=A0A2V2Z0Q8_9BACL|nr:MarR family transcriptional regulator [Paenibacillus cellulosilyticus]PWW08654.1 DNA-binding MarR family transcriptional regulator [Paenibacillus cellulosilyticus]QKS48218.1 MarR family transcriptional regulator [Paenibacillus cellulosilyticus]